MLTLAQFTLGSLPFFQMKIEKFPAWVHNELDRGTMQCVRRKHEGIKGTHLMNQKTLIRPKRLGRVNLKATKKMNWALLAKLAWRVLNSDGEVWCEVLKSKYNVGEEDDAHFKEKHRSSKIWKGMVWGRGSCSSKTRGERLIMAAIFFFGGMSGWILHHCAQGRIEWWGNACWSTRFLSFWKMG